ncbi:helix-turn-helix protein [Bifidobacterium saguini DSM 23967]|uniref:Helix-turn-helix protein n=1 Tax=Bifidobacterium saguini DSM 23967 TaxID=1437607 RepID=A0A087D613_9BIFI|nr:helix-turn-helix protein [Bifidobacterium saguini DSM 23967]
MAMPNATKRRQDVLAMNVSRMLTARGLRKKDLAHAMGVSPQAMASRLQSKANWTLDEACSAADFLHVSLDLLMKDNLTAAEVLGYANTATSDESKNGGISASNEWGRRGLNPGPGDYESHALTD